MLTKRVVLEMLWLLMFGPALVAAGCHNTTILANVGIVGLSMLVGAGAAFRLARPAPE